MNHLPFSKSGGVAASLIASGLLAISSASGQTNYYFDPGASGGTGSGGSGEFNGPIWYNGTIDTTFASGNNAIFDGSAGTVTVNAPVSANYLEVGATSGTETIGTSGVDASQITLGPILKNQLATAFQVDAGSENVVFNSNVNLNLEGQTYGFETAAPSATSGNVTFNGGITFTDNVTLATDPTGNSTGSPGLGLSATAPGGTITLNSAVTLVTAPGAEPTQNGNTPVLGFAGSSASNTLTLTSGASFVGTRIEANGGTVLDQGATFSNVSGENTNGPILIGNGGQFLAGTAGMTISDSVQFQGGGGSLGSDVAGVTTFSGSNSYNNSLVAISYAGSSPVNLTAGAGSRVNILGDVVNGNGYSINKTGAGTVNINDGYNFRIQGGGWDVQNGTLLANSNGTITNGTVPGTNPATPIGLTIENVATSALSSTQTYATLGGNAGVSALVTALGANSSLTPGDPTVNGGLGTLSLNGGLMANNGVTLNFTIDAAGDSSLLFVPDLTLNGPVQVNFSTLDSVTTGINYILVEGGNSNTDWTLGDNLSFNFTGPAGYEVSSYTLDTTGDSLSVQFEAVPEPSTWALMSLGAVVVIGAARFCKLA